MQRSSSIAGFIYFAFCLVGERRNKTMEMNPSDFDTPDSRLLTPIPAELMAKMRTTVRGLLLVSNL